MRICLISAATATDFGEHAKHKNIRETAEDPPLGILTLAAILREQSFAPTVLDLNRIYYSWLTDRTVRTGCDFSTWAASQVPPDFDVIGFSTICSSYPLTIRIAEQVKRAHPQSTILFGGPQASAVDVATLEAFPFVDLIVRGEADETLSAILRTGVRSPALAFLPGITFRSGASIVRNGEAPLVSNLDALPVPAFDLLITGKRRIPHFPLELGRGCPFACTFCSTNDFFRRRFRLKSPDTVLAHMRRMAREYGSRTFDLVHDMFTVDRKRVVAFCETLIDSKERFFWGCSARTDCVDDDLIALMQRAGCRSVFFGVETGSPALQRSIEKDLDLNDAAARIAACTNAGIETTVSLIVGFPEETEEDLWQTVAFFMEAARFERVQAQFHIVAPLAGTPLFNRFRGRLLADDVLSDMSYQGWKQDERDKELIAAHPDVFPNFYGVPVASGNRPRLKRLRDFLLYGMQRFRLVMLALHQSRGGIREVFEAWEHDLPWLAESREERGSWYASADFRREFVRFIRARYLDHQENSESLAALVRLEEGMWESPAERPRRKTGPLPRIAVRMFDFDIDIRVIVDRLRRREGLSPPKRRRVTIATRARQGRGTDILELTSLSASFLKLCDGRSLERIAAELPLDPILEDLGRDRLSKLVLRELVRQRLLSRHFNSRVRRAVPKLREAPDGGSDAAESSGASPAIAPPRRGRPRLLSTHG